MNAPLQYTFAENAFKHGVTEDEIIEVFANHDRPCLVLHFKGRGDETIYNALGVSESGRYLTIGFVKITERTYRVIHADDMKDSERRRFKKIRKRI